MKNILFMMTMAAMVFAGCKKDGSKNVTTPPYAASTMTWTFGEQTWSDVIHCPECNKETFKCSYTDPQCCNYTENGKTRCYYNWPYVATNATTLCPSPWRVPTESDFWILVSNTTYSTLHSAWDYGGLADGNPMCRVGSYATYWSSTETGSGSAYNLGFGTGGYFYPQYYYYHRCNGFQIRCIK
jgi:hypothetical protein